MSKYVFWFLLFCSLTFGQEKNTNGYFDLNYIRGNILNHVPDIYHLITGHPKGLILSYNFKTTGNKEWHSIYNYPDYGVSFLFQDFENQYLGKNFAINAHYNFYFLNRNLMLRISQGIAMTTNPYDKDLNFKNIAFGSRFMSSNYFLLHYQKPYFVGPIGFNAGLSFTHFSNGRIKSPNRGINTYGINLGLNYNLGKPFEYPKVDSIAKFKEPIRFNFTFRSGINEGAVEGSGQKPFYHFSTHVDKRIGRKSALQFGTELFFTQSVKEYIAYRAVAYPELEPIDPNTDYRRVSVFAGHELFINRLSVEAQLGVYVYNKFREGMDVYQRLGLKYYITPELFTGVALKSHGTKAEAMEWGIGVRL